MRVLAFVHSVRTVLYQTLSQRAVLKNGGSEILRSGAATKFSGTFYRRANDSAANKNTLQEDEFLRRPAVKIFIPDALKSILVDDWEKVTKENKVAPTPAPISVTQFLAEYHAAESVHRREGSADYDILEEVIAGVKEYFNKALGRILLYRFERNQFSDWHKQLEKGHGEHAGKTLCDIYGCEHLLRLFGKKLLLTFVYFAKI